jgi:hypothetical protein
MIPFEVYKILHLFGIALLLLGLGVVLGAFALTPKVSGKIKIVGFASHGLGLLLILTGGFGMAARMGLVNGLPLWIYGKLAVWAFMAVAISLVKRKAQSSFVLVGLIASFVAVATWLAIFKPV